MPDSASRSPVSASSGPAACAPGRAGGLGQRVSAAWGAFVDALAAARDRRLLDPGFRARALRWPFVRGLARRRAARLFDLVAGFVYSQVLAACVQTRLLERLARDGPLTADALAPGLGLSPEAAVRLLRAAAALDLVAPRRGGCWGLGPLGAPMVGQPGLAEMVAHHAALYRDLADPLRCLRGEPGELAAFWGYAHGDRPDDLASAEVAAYSALMAASNGLVSGPLLEAFPWHRHRHRHLLDLGGGEGVFACAAARAVPHLRVTVFDLPAVVGRTRERFAREGLADRCDAVGGDFFREAPPAGADVVSLLRVIHDHDDDRVRTLLAAARRALAPGGALVVAEPLAGTPGARAMGDAYFGLYLAAMGRGEPRTEARLRALLAEAGFRSVRRLPTPLPLQASVLVARA